MSIQNSIRQLWRQGDSVAEIARKTDASLDAGDGAQAARPRSHQRAHVEGLNAVVERVGRADDAPSGVDARGGAGGVERLGGEAGARRMRDGLHPLPARAGERGHVHAAHLAGDAVVLAVRGDEGLVAVGLDAAQLVVDVQDGELALLCRGQDLGQLGDERRLRRRGVVELEGDGGRAAQVLRRQLEERRRIGPSRDHEQHGDLLQRPARARLAHLSSPLPV